MTTENCILAARKLLKKLEGADRPAYVAAKADGGWYDIVIGTGGYAPDIVIDEANCDIGRVAENRADEIARAIGAMTEAEWDKQYGDD